MPRALHDPIDRWAEERGGSIALISSSGRRVSYAELSRLSRSIAASLRGFGVARGDRVALVARNSIELVAAFFGCVRSGAAAVAIDPATISEDLRFQLEDSGAKVVFADSSVLSREGKVIGEAGVERVVVLDDGRELGGFPGEVVGLRDLIGRPSMTAEEVPVDPERDVAVVFYYAGIAGRTEQVLHSHAAPLRCAEEVARVLGIGPGDNTLLVVPLPHVLGMVQVVSHIVAGGSVTVLERAGGMDESQIAEVADRLGVTSIWSVPTLYVRLVERSGEVRLPGRIRYCLSAGGYLPPDVQRRFVEAFGVPLVQMYGLTEGWVVTLQPLELAGRLGTIGLPLPGVEHRIVREDGSEVTGPGEVGELMVRMPWVMLRYADPKDTELAIRDGWLRTGDLVSRDETGLLYFRGVKKRVIKYKGYPVFPRDLEELLRRHPAVRDALVKGEPDPETGERPVAFVVLREGYEGRVSEGELMDFVNSRVAGYKKLRGLRFVRSLAEVQ